MTSPHNPQPPGFQPVPASPGSAPYGTPGGQGPTQHPGPTFQGPYPQPGLNPYAQQSTPQPGGLPGTHPGPKLGGPFPGQATPRKKFTVPLLIGGGVALIVVIALITYLLASGFAKSPKAQAQEAVQKFMTALAAGKAEDVKSYLSESVDRSLITDAVLQESLKKAPITDIKIPEPKEQQKEVFAFDVGYAIGGKQGILPIEATLPQNKNETPKLKPEMTRIVLRLFEGLPVTVNGVKSEQKTPTVLPGTYTIGIDNQYYTVEEPNTVTVTDTITVGKELKPALSETGTTAFRAKLKETVEACLAEKTLASSCKLTVPASNGEYVFQEGTVQRTMDTSGLDSVKLILNATNPTIAKTSGTLPKVNYAFGCTKAGQPTSCEFSRGGPQLKVASIDMTKPELTVSWL